MPQTILLVVLAAALLPSAPIAGDSTEVAVTVSSLEVPRVGTTAEFERLIRDYETQDGRVHATFKPASWVSVVVRFRPAGQESPTDVWAAEPQLHRVHQSQLVPAGDTFITPGEMRRFREAAELAVQSSTFVVLDRSRALDDRARARMTIYWRLGARGTVDLYGISREFRRQGAVLSDNTDGTPIVVLLYGPTRKYVAEFAREPGEEEALMTRGIPADRIVEPGIARCGILRELPDGIVRGELADVQPVLVENSRVRGSYPEQARIYRTGGTVILDVMLDDEGKVVGVVVKRAVPGFPSFARSVVDAVCGLQYMPAMQAGTPVQSVVE